MNLDKHFETNDAKSYLATEEAIFRLVQSDPRYLEPTLSRLLFLRFRLVFDQWHDTDGGSTQVLGVYEAIRGSCMLRHVTIARGAYGSFDLKNGITVKDKAIKKSVIKSIEREYVHQDLPAIRDESSNWTNTNYVEVEWMFNRSSRQAGWELPNSIMSSLHEKLRQLAQSLLAIESP